MDRPGGGKHDRRNLDSHPAGRSGGHRCHRARRGTTGGAAATAALKAAPAARAAANPNPSNPLANITWGNYTDASLDPVFNAYGKATGNAKTLLGNIAFKPRVRWFGSWIPDNKISRSP